MSFYLALNSRKYCCGGGTGGRLGVELRPSHILKKCPIVLILVFSIAFVHVHVMESSGMWFELLCPSVTGIPAKNTDPYSNSFRKVALASATSPIPSLMSLQAVLKTDPMYEEIVDCIWSSFL